MQQKTDGDFVATGSRTILVSLDTLYEAWKDLRNRRRWLADPVFTVRRATLNKSMRIVWGDGETEVDVDFQDAGYEKSQVSVKHRKLSSDEEVETRKVYWRRQLASLATSLTE